MRIGLIGLGLAAACGGLACVHAARIHPRAIEHNNYCAAYLKQGELEKAETRCDLALEFNPNYPEPYCNLGLIEIQRNHLDKAKDFFIKAIRLNQDFAEAHNGLGYVFLQQGSLHKARDEFERALQVNPDYFDARFNLARTLLRLKDYPAARKADEALVESNPTLADPHDDLCVLDLSSGDVDDAIDECRTAIRLAPRFAVAYFNLGDAYMRAGKYCVAQQAYGDCLRADGTQDECRNNLSIATRKCALLDPNLKDAASEPQPGGQSTPETGADDTAAAWYAKGVSQVNAGLVNEARVSFHKCVRRDAQYALCDYQLYKLDLAVQDTSSAQSDCKRMLEISSGGASQERDECKNFLAAGAQP